MDPGFAYVLPAGFVTRARWPSTLHVASIEFSPTLIERLLQGSAPAPTEQFIPALHPPDVATYHLMKAIVAELAMPTERLYGEMLCVALAVHVLHLYGRQDARALSFPGRLSPIRARHVLEYMRANLDGDLRVSVLAALAGLSEAHFARGFRATFNESPHQTVMRWRIERASRLISRDGVDLAEAATMAGFCDQAHLTNALRRRVVRCLRRPLDAVGGPPDEYMAPPNGR